MASPLWIGFGGFSLICDSFDANCGNVSPPLLGKGEFQLGIMTRDLVDDVRWDLVVPLVY